MKALIIGDVVGRPGRKALSACLSELRRGYEAEFVVVNVENAAAGAGVIPRAGEEILHAGGDVMTSGNHIFDKKEVFQYIENEPRRVPPFNYPADSPTPGTR